MTGTLSTIPEYFTGKSVFVTGGTGFIGKVLIEKILRSCPDVSNVYVLVRPKKGKSVEERIKEITELPLFDRLKDAFPENLKKIVPIVGDVTELDLGISPEDRSTLINEVSFVYHIAASVRFDDSLRDAVIMNARGTREVVLLAKQMRRLEVLVHFSTTYCHTDKRVVEEKIYPPTVDWRTAIELAEKADPHVLDVFTAKYTEPFPNTYTFTKGLAEHVVNDLCDGVVPAVIIRPSIVISTMLDPVPGWIDNFNGPVGILVASGKGIMRSVYANPQITSDYVPCDILVKGTILATWKRGLESPDEKYKLKVYNGSTNKIRPVTIGEIVFMGKKLCWETPLNDVVWYPNGSITNCWYYNYLRVLFYQLLPALFLDCLLVLLKKKPMLIKIHRKIFIANNAVQYFLRDEWTFDNKQTVALEGSLLPEDVEAFSYQTDHPLSEPYAFFTMGLMGARRYLLKEPDETLAQAKVHSRRMWLIAQTFNAMWYITAFFLLRKLVYSLNILSRINDAYLYFNS
ncbi:putative fatty acyl-CoA reductase CG5065 [Anoplophora glabripennis]|uniref:putative fatty acyl-CoA reductase CG5065 n=1 Tax=Anoplophora glabripennis TaxID=217634 RepID=UPI0008735700|nr:putative fatty acyl-CoA reductase CG5065 [Anoplophora glabripennis]